jgi:hypothetical protein
LLQRVPPPWLKPIAFTAAPANRPIEPIPQPDDAEAKTDEPEAAELPKFDAKHALILLIAQKMSGIWPTAPKEIETREFLLKHFKGVPNGPHREIRHKAWPGQIRRGPRKRIYTGK